MKTRVDVATARPLTSLLTSSGLRDAIAMPSVWHRPSRPTTVAVNRFRSDYPLYLALIACWSLDTLGRQHEVCVSIVDVKCVARFCVDPVRVFLQLLRVTNDRDRDLGYPVPRRFVPVVHRASQEWLDTVGLAAPYLVTAVHERCCCFSSPKHRMSSAVGRWVILSTIEKHALSGLFLLQIMRFRLPANLLNTKCVSEQSIRTQRSRK